MLCGRQSLCSPHLRSGELCATSWWAKFVHKFGVLPGRCISPLFPPSVQSIIHVHQCGLMGIHFTLGVIVQYHFIFLLTVLSFGCRQPSSHHSGAMPGECRVCTLPSFLALQDAAGSSCIVPASVLKPVIFLGISGSFFGEWCLILRSGPRVCSLPLRWHCFWVISDDRVRKDM